MSMCMGWQHQQPTRQCGLAELARRLPKRILRVSLIQPAETPYAAGVHCSWSTEISDFNAITQWSLVLECCTVIRRGAKNQLMTTYQAGRHCKTRMPSEHWLALDIHHLTEDAQNMGKVAKHACRLMFTATCLRLPGHTLTPQSLGASL